MAGLAHGHAAEGRQRIVREGAFAQVALDLAVLVTVAQGRENELLELSKGFSVPVTRIGEITESGDLLVLDSERRPYDIRKLGFDHFLSP